MTQDAVTTVSKWVYLSREGKSNVFTIPMIRVKAANRSSCKICLCLLSVVGKFTTSAHIQSETEDHLELQSFSWWAKVCKRSCNFFLDIKCHFKNFVLGFRILLDKAGILHLIWKRWKSCKLYNRKNFMLIGMDGHNPEKSLKNQQFWI